MYILTFVLAGPSFCSTSKLVLYSRTLLYLLTMHFTNLFSLILPIIDRSLVTKILECARPSQNGWQILYQFNLACVFPETYIISLYKRLCSVHSLDSMSSFLVILNSSSLEKYQFWTKIGLGCLNWHFCKQFFSVISILFIVEGNYFFLPSPGF